MSSIGKVCEDHTKLTNLEKFLQVIRKLFMKDNLL